MKKTNLAPKDLHFMDEFTDSSALLVMANTEFEKEDYIFEPYRQAINKAF